MEKKSLILTVSGVLFVLMFIAFAKSMYSFRIEAAKLKIPMRDISDLKYILLFTLFHIVFRFIFSKLVYSKLAALVKKGNFKDEPVRIKKSSKYLKDIFTYAFFSIYGYRIAKNKSFLPSAVFGSGESCSIMGTSWPNTDMHEDVRWFLMFQFGHHLQSLVFHTVRMRGHGNYYELVIHHFATIFSLVYSYFTNWEDFAVFVLFVSDFADIFLTMGKLWRDLGGGEKVLIFLFSTILITWGATRVVLLPYCFGAATLKLFTLGNPYDSQYSEMWYGMRYGTWFVCFNIYMIVLLNIFWFWILLEAGLSKFITKTRKTIESDIIGEVNHDNDTKKKVE